MKPFVTICVTAYLEQSKPYLDLCIESIKNLDYPKDRLEVIIVSPHWYMPMYDDVATLCPTTNKYYNARALNYGMSQAAIHSEYFFLINDDCLLTTYSLSNLVAQSVAIGDVGIMMGIGNDQQMRYALPLQIPSGPYRIEQVKDVAKDMMNLKSPYAQGLMFCETLCLYAVLIPRSIYDVVGGFDDSNCGKDDIDMSLRVRKAGFLNIIALSSLVWHAGGPSADITFTPEMRKQSQAQFERKWPDER